MLKNWIVKLKRLGFLEKLFLALLPVYLILTFAAPGSVLLPLTQIALLVMGAWIAFKLTLAAMRKSIWRLRNRLLVTYGFIAVVPVLLILVLACMGAYVMVSQLAVYLTVSDLERRAIMLRDVAETVAATESQLRPELMHRVSLIHHKRFPNLTVLVREGGVVQNWPPGGTSSPPPEGWAELEGVAVRNGRYYLWSHAKSGRVEVTAMMPLSRRYLSGMVPGLGDVSLYDVSDQKAKLSEEPADKADRKNGLEQAAHQLPPAFNRFDIDVRWFSTVPVWHWDQPGKKEVAVLFVHTRPSAVLNTIFNAQVDQMGNVLPIALMVVTILFFIVEIVALIIGSSLTRTITGAVHNLYQGTQSVIQGDFSHRIHVHGKDQLATLSTSFNSMTENLERLLAVAKEKERLQAELEIARQVQEQLYPKVMPTMQTLRLKAVCEPARMVSGDYYDYLSVPDGRVAFALGDVSGKGISAALLMATIQSAMRMELRTSRVDLSTSRVVSDLNQQLHATTSPEKYATFFFGLFNEESGELTYTNAGHLPPVVVRNGSAERLEVSGTVVGAFPMAKYEEDRIYLRNGDLLVCYTDGITEPENEYGEEFGEERLIDLVTRNAERDEGQIIGMVIDAVRQWTSAAEQPDDMTLLLARRI